MFPTQTTASLIRLATFLFAVTNLLPYSVGRYGASLLEDAPPLPLHPLQRQPKSFPRKLPITPNFYMSHRTRRSGFTIGDPPRASVPIHGSHIPSRRAFFCEPLCLVSGSKPCAPLSTQPFRRATTLEMGKEKGGTTSIATPPFRTRDLPGRNAFGICVQGRRGVGVEKKVDARQSVKCSCG